MPADELAPCPGAPNCVSSDSREDRHAIGPLLLTSLGKKNWMLVRETVLSLPRTTIVAEHENHLQAECRSAWAGFVDDLELQLRPGKGVIAIRSASRTGHYDFGVNRRRVEKLRDLLRERGLVQPLQCLGFFLPEFAG